VSGQPTVRRAVLQTDGRISLEAAPAPAPGPDDVTVRVAAVGVCGSDVHYWRDGAIGDLIVDRPLVLGHEAAGVIVAAGADVPSERVGQRVAIEPQRPCDACGVCLEGDYHLCPRMRFYGTPPVDGAFVEQVTIGARFAHRVPDALSDAEAALIEPAAVGMWAAHTAAIEPGDEVVVTGAGAIGLLAAQAARLRGASRVIVRDVRPERLAFARALGVDDAHDARDVPPPGFDVLIECSGSEAALSGALPAARPRARIVLVGAADGMTVPARIVQNRELRLTGTFRYAHMYPATIAAVASGRLELARLITHRFALDEVAAALETAGSDPTAIKVLVEPGRLVSR
jgi:L-iditol 2-dehydrogenase